MGQWLGSPVSNRSFIGERSTTSTNARSKQIDAMLLQQRRLEQRKIKLLLLGAAEAGKTTLLKQMKIIHAEGFTLEQLRQQRPLIYANLIQCMITLLNAMDMFKLSFEVEEHRLDAQVIQEIAALHREHETPSPVTIAALFCLWDDKSIQKCFQRRCEFHLIDSAKYFLDSIRRIGEPNYLPTHEDVLRARIQTTGINEVHFEVRNLQFRVVDVGGQRTERRKWLHCFDNVHAIIFVSSLSEYDQNMKEDDATNRMQDSLLLFRWVCALKFFMRISFMLFLNKTDIFKEKLETTPITVAFPKYKGENTFEAATNYIKRKFLRCNHSIERRIYTHFTCATDTRQIQFVLDSCLDVIIKQNMGRFGME